MRSSRPGRRRDRGGGRRGFSYIFHASKGTESEAYHLTLGFGSPANRHSKVIVFPSSDCLMTGRSVNVGLTPSSGTGASSPGFDKKETLVLADYTPFRLRKRNTSLMGDVKSTTDEKYIHPRAHISFDIQHSFGISCC